MAAIVANDFGQAAIIAQMSSSTQFPTVVVTAITTTSGPTGALVYTGAAYALNYCNNGQQRVGDYT